MITRAVFKQGNQILHAPTPLSAAKGIPAGVRYDVEERIGPRGPEWRLTRRGSGRALVVVLGQRPVDDAHQET